MIKSEILLALPHFEITAIQREKRHVGITARYTGPLCCPDCGGSRLRNKGWCERTVRHENWGLRHVLLHLSVRKSHCLDCGRYFRQPLPGILPRKRASEAFQKHVCQQHLDGVSRSQIARREGIGPATAERYFSHGLELHFKRTHSPQCPMILGIDEHFFTRRRGYATTFCDLKNRKVYDVVLGRSEPSLEGYLNQLQGKDQVRLICIDLSTTYRSLVRKHFPNADILADRFHVVRLVGHHFMACWREFDPAGARDRGLNSLLRRHPRKLTAVQRENLNRYFAVQPAVAATYAFKQRLWNMLSASQRTAKQCRHLAGKFLRAVADLRDSGLTQLVTLGDTLAAWSDEIGRMWRYTRNNGITEGFHNKMELISRQAYGFRNFENYRRRVAVLCG